MHTHTSSQIQGTYMISIQDRHRDIQTHAQHFIWVHTSMHTMVTQCISLTCLSIPAQKTKKVVDIINDITQINFT